MVTTLVNKWKNLIKGNSFQKKPIDHLNYGIISKKILVYIFKQIKWFSFCKKIKKKTSLILTYLFEQVQNPTSEQPLKLNVNSGQNLTLDHPTVHLLTSLCSASHVAFLTLAANKPDIQVFKRKCEENRQLHPKCITNKVNEFPITSSAQRPRNSAVIS